MNTWRSAHSARAGLFPDAVTDGEQRRRIGAARRIEAVRRVRREAVRRGSDGVLVLLTVPVPGELYEREAHAAARRHVAELVSGWPAWFKLEKGAGGALHAHVITTTDAVPGVLHRREVHGVPVWHLRGLLAYLSKPADGAAARSNRRRAVPESESVQAAERYLSARACAAAAGRSRVPACSGVVNVPPRRRAALSVPLLLAVYMVQMVRKVQAAERYSAVLRVRRSRRGEVRRSSVRHRAVICWHLPGAAVRSRRVALIGHARPPPQRSAALLVNGPRSAAVTAQSA